MQLVPRLFYFFLLLSALVIVIGGKCPTIGMHFLATGTADGHVGDLYRLCEVDRFKEAINVVASPAKVSLEQAEILTLGDSFFNSSLESELFANELTRRGGISAHNVEDGSFFEPHSYPLAYLKSSNYKPNKRRILILESVERSSLGRANSYLASASSSANQLNALAFKALKNNDVEYFFKNNVVIHPPLKWLKNARFTWFGLLDRSIGAYSLQPDMLFYQRDLDFAAVPKPDFVVEKAADQVARVADLLRRQYDLDLLYVVVPDKYSVYRDYLSHAPKYDRYIPRLVNKLRSRGVHTVDLYSAYLEARQNSKAPLYFISDSHYTAAGKAILVDLCLREIAMMNKKAHQPTGHGKGHLL